MREARRYPTRPYLAVSAAIFRDGRVLIVRRARPPAQGLYTLPGGVVEIGETLVEAVVREVREETALTIAPVALAGYREALVRDAPGGSSGISSFCRSPPGGLPARSRSTRNWPRHAGFFPRSFPG